MHSAIPSKGVAGPTQRSPNNTTQTSFRHQARSAVRQVWHTCSASPSTAQQESAQSNGTGAKTAFPADLLEMFGSAQRNLMEVNRSRLNALQELGAAQARIAELEQQLQAASYGQSPEPRESGGPAALPAPSEPQPQTKEDLHRSPEVPQAVEQPQITIAYQTGWHKAFLHFCTDLSDWTTAPGKEMLPESGDWGGSRVLRLDAHQVEFVVNNGTNDWDTPDPYGLGGQRNYKITSPGKYRLKSGKVIKLD